MFHIPIFKTFWLDQCVRKNSYEEKCDGTWDSRYRPAEIDWVNEQKRLQRESQRKGWRSQKWQSQWKMLCFRNTLLHANNTCMNTHTYCRYYPLYTHILGWTGSYQGYQTIRRVKEERRAEDRVAFLLQLNLFKSSLWSCVCVCVCIQAAVWLTAVILLSQ